MWIDFGRNNVKPNLFAGKVSLIGTVKNTCYIPKKLTSTRTTFYSLYMFNVTAVSCGQYFAPEYWLFRVFENGYKHNTPTCPKQSKSVVSKHLLKTFKTSRIPF